jgi:cytochrome c oxidase subunit I+III
LWNQIASAGSLLIAASMIVFIVNVVMTLRRGPPAPDNPWEASTLEWATSSPPPSYNFAHVPVVAAREPLWAGDLEWMEGLSSEHREVLCTTVVDAQPDLRQASPDPSIWPLLTALATTALFIGSIFHEWALVWGSIPVALCLIGWFWPKEPAKTRRAVA